jgi:hypothetical protein
MAQQDHDPDLNRLGRELRGLTPRPCPINRDAVMFRAGQASVPRSWLWPVLTALSIGLAVTFAAALFIQPAQAPVPNYPTIVRPLPGAMPSQPSMLGSQDVSVPQSDDAVASEGDDRPTPHGGYLGAENNILRWGLDGIPMPPTTAAPRPAEKPEMLMRSF